MKAWKTECSRTLLDVSPWIVVHSDEIRLPNNRLVREYCRVWMPPFAAVVPLTRDGKILLLRHYKHGAGRVIFGFPAGHIEKGERPLPCAKRELMEETGYVAKSWTALGSFICNANRGCGKGHFFAARDAVFKQRPQVDDIEECEVVLMRPKDALKLLDMPHQLSMVGALALSLACRALRIRS